MRRASKVDRNQPEIIAALRRVGASVCPLHAVGKGCPDLLVGYCGRNILMEVKDGDLVPSARKLNPGQVEWHDIWRGQVITVNSVDDAIAALASNTVEIPFRWTIS